MRLVRSWPVLLGTVLCISGGVSSAKAQADPGASPQTRFDRILHHFDIGVSGIGEFDSSVSGKVQNSIASNGTLSQQQFRPVAGVLATIRAQKSPWVGGEFNYRLAKYTYTFTYSNSNVQDFYTQNTANEYTLGYIARPDHQLLGFKPFVGGGAGTVEFKPSRSTGSGLPVQARAAYYYTLGGDKPLYSDVFGLRVGFRQVFSLAPDFGQNYLLIKKLSTSTEPTLGLYVHF